MIAWFLLGLPVSVESVIADSPRADSTTDDSSSRPNVILIVTDDQGYGDMSCHGNPWLKTPNLDRLASESVRLDDYHVDPVCTPTRAALMTGRYCSRVGAWAVTQGRQLLGRDEFTMANVFADSGYRTAMFGKWHLGDTWPYAPRFRGFQDVVCHRAGGVDEIGNPVGNDFFDDTYYRNGVPESFEGYCTDIFFNELIRSLGADSDQPFFAYLPLNAMHSPHEVDDKYSQRFRDQGHPEARAKFYGMIENFDENLGRLLDSLRRQQLDQNTIVIFMGDNGTAAGIGPDDHPKVGFNAGMRGKKGSTFEGGHRMACFARWPDRFPAGARVNELTCHRDWLPTLIELCGLDRPDEVDFDGQSIAPLLKQTSSDWPQRRMFVERQADKPSRSRLKKQKSQYPHMAVLTERWRMVDHLLFDIQSDPGQTKDVAGKHPEVVAKLTAAYGEYYDDVYAHDGAYQRFQIGIDEENPTRFTVRDWHPTKGNVIWKQEQLGDDSIRINGFWAVDVVHRGTYQIRLSRHPEDAPAPMNATRAELNIGSQTLSRAVQPENQSVSFTVELDAGPTMLKTLLSGDDPGNQRGAYFVWIHRL